jgi:hypothetical protein
LNFISQKRSEEAAELLEQKNHLAEEEAMLLSRKAMEVEQEILKLKNYALKTEEEKIHLERKSREAESLTARLGDENLKVELNFLLILIFHSRRFTKTCSRSGATQK